MFTTRSPKLLILLMCVSLVVAIAGCTSAEERGGASKTGGGGEAPKPASETPAPDGGESTSPSSATHGTTVPIKAYFIRSDMDTSGNRNQELVAPVRRTAKSPAVVKEAVLALLAGPTPAEMDAKYTSAVPPAIKVLGVSLKDRVATVDLSGSFASGGGSASMRARVAQLVFTVTQFDSVDAVSLKLDGKAVTEIGGEGLVLEGPQSRDEWEDLSPEILIESPVFGDTFASPMKVTGTSNSFEAQFGLELKTGKKVLAQMPNVHATSGTGERGTFEATLTFSAAGAQTATLEAFNESPKDGHRYTTFDVTGPVR